MNNQQADIVIVGSLNMDLVIRAKRMPRPGETLAGDTFTTVPGGKGANQAVAAARLGASVAMVGCVGDDAYGERLRAGLMIEAIDCRALTTLSNVSTGVASIVVDEQSQNAILIVAGANGQLTPELLEQFDAVLDSARIVICQLEVPVPTVQHALTRARQLGKTVILNPAPAVGPLPAEWYPLIDYLVPNESEAQALTGIAVNSPESAEQAARILRDAGARNVVITLGERGVFKLGDKGGGHWPAPSVNALDSTAAGDTFVGGFAAALAAGQSEGDALRFAQAAAALSVTRAGAQPSIPTYAEVKDFSRA
ncbi:ribokinase [Pseudomonas sp. DC3000-4b1]|uniref:ribokinase n=1 Tax=unclassified Pseudomonas TaxID=196821 RepID=UPI003CEFB4FD